MEYLIFSKKILQVFFFVFLLYALCSILPIKAFADNMNSSHFQIEFGNINIASGNKSSSSYQISDTLGQTAAGEFQSTGYIILAGFQYIHSIIPFKFSISNINMNLGTISPNTFAQATTALTVSFGGAGQYQVTTVEEGKLSTLAGISIPDTACDGSPGCTPTSAAPWTQNNSAYGFGYNMSGQDVPNDFLGGSYYRPFADDTQAGIPTVIMSNPNVGRNRQSTLTVRANVSNAQPNGTYQTILNFVATPSY